MAEISLQDCEIPVENLLGKEFGGQAVFTSSMEWERICILASHLGRHAEHHGNLREVRQRAQAVWRSRSESFRRSRT